MSLKYQQYRAILRAKDLLSDIVNPGKNLTIEEIKERAYSALYHFPALTEKGEPIFSKDNFEEI